ncbi:MAG TPA: hypothetical protein PKC67_14860 [Kiritimatiellia bacterium]|nr:hypothetical protein [Kiritimatiellia bacterium]HMP35615.1 hypothetical protein [Kiritimatiellia bacterium]
MMNRLKTLLFDPQVPDGNLARREQVMIVALLVLAAVVITAWHILHRGG